jgi:protein required for attachment to host cells
LAHALNASFERREFDQLVVVAPRRSLGELRKLLPIRVLRAVALEIAKDLTAESPAALWKRVADDVKPIL